MSRSSYVDPRVIDLYLDGSTIRATLERLDNSPPQGSATHGPIEAAVLDLFQGASRQAAA